MHLQISEDAEKVTTVLNSEMKNNYRLTHVSLDYDCVS